MIWKIVLLVGFLALTAYFIWSAVKDGILSDTEIASIKQWLVFAVSVAEKEFGEKTGKLKFASVYASFVEKFPRAASIVSVDLFSVWVDDALKDLEKFLTNDKIRDILGVSNEINDGE